MSRDEPFNIDEAIARVREAVASYPKAALFELAEEGFDTPFEVLVACIISIRTRDEDTLPCARRLFAEARRPEAVAALTPEAIDTLIRPSTFHENKAGQIRAIAREVVEVHGGAVPCNEDVLTGFHGVGPKCAHLVLGIACGEPQVSVDTHVHRITNRWGYVATDRPEQTMRALEAKLPTRHWVDINRLLVPFGKHVCTRRRPHCSACPLQAMCAQVGVEAPR